MLSVIQLNAALLSATMLSVIKQRVVVVKVIMPSVVWLNVAAPVSNSGSGWWCTRQRTKEIIKDQFFVKLMSDKLQRFHGVWSKNIWPTDIWSTDILPIDIWPKDILPTEVWLTDILPTDI
jgi:hypothetical protein